MASTIHLAGESGSRTRLASASTELAQPMAQGGPNPSKAHHAKGAPDQAPPALPCHCQLLRTPAATHTDGCVPRGQDSRELREFGVGLSDPHEAARPTCLQDSQLSEASVNPTCG